MAELTARQIDDAVEAFGIEWDQQKGLGAIRIICERRGLSAAAPSLQFPLDEPTHDEIARVSKYANYGTEIVERILVPFVRLRNAPLQKQVDPRREKVVFILETCSKRPPELADEILAAIDRVKR